MTRLQHSRQYDFPVGPNLPIDEDRARRGLEPLHINSPREQRLAAARLRASGWHHYSGSAYDSEERSGPTLVYASDDENSGAFAVIDPDGNVEICVDQEVSA